jgi:hypothetical protein
VLKLIRWILVAPLAAFAWISVFVVSLMLYSAIDTYCPESYQVSGTCVWEWSVLAKELLIVAGASVSAVLVVGIAALTAPAHKARVAVITFAIGLAVAIWMLLETNAWAAFTGAAVCGLLTTATIYRRKPRRAFSDSYERRLFV